MIEYKKMKEEDFQEYEKTFVGDYKPKGYFCFMNGKWEAKILYYKSFKGIFYAGCKGEKKDIRFPKCWVVIIPNSKKMYFQDANFKYLKNAKKYVEEKIKEKYEVEK